MCTYIYKYRTDIDIQDIDGYRCIDIDVQMEILDGNRNIDIELWIWMYMQEWIQMDTER